MVHPPRHRVLTAGGADGLEPHCTDDRAVLVVWRVFSDGDLYCGWQHWGQAIGNPFFSSPLYNHTADLTFTSNRFKSHHLAIAGQPLPFLSYRMFYSHQRSLGTYNTPFYRAHTSHDLVLDVTWSPERLGKLRTSGWHVGAAFAFDRGSLIGNNTGFQLTISKTGLLTK